MQSWIEGGRARGVIQDDLPWSWTNRQPGHPLWRGAARTKCQKKRSLIIRRRSPCCRPRHPHITLTRRSTRLSIRTRIHRLHRFIRIMDRHLRLIRPRPPPPHGSITRPPRLPPPPPLSTLHHLTRKSLFDLAFY